MGNLGCCKDMSVVNADEKPNTEPFRSNTEKPCQAESDLKNYQEMESTKPNLVQSKSYDGGIDKLRLEDRKPSMVRVKRKHFVQDMKGDIFTRYEITKKLGSGSFGCVYKARNIHTGAERAIKTISKLNISESQRRKMKNEIEILKALDHPNIIRIYEVYEDYKCIHLVLELCRGGELFKKILEKRKFTEKDIASYLYQILSAVLTCHKEGIVHRDLKPENILFQSESEDSHIKIIDFGTSTRVRSHGKMNSFTGTVSYK